MKVAICIQDFPKLGTPEYYKVGDEVVMDGHNITAPGWMIMPCEFPHFFRIDERPDGPWKPRECDEFYFIDSSLQAGRTTFHGAAASHRSILDAGNCFRTEQEAESKIPAVRNALQGRSLKDVLDGMVHDIKHSIHSRREAPCGSLYIAEVIIKQILAAWEAR